MSTISKNNFVIFVFDIFPTILHLLSSKFSTTGIESISCSIIFFATIITLSSFSTVIILGVLVIIIPIGIYNEEENIANFYKAVTDVMSGLTYDYELIFVDDGSSDSSAMILREIAYNDKHVKVLLLARNFGHQTALTCGLDYAHGDAVITMDGDMQHPPALIPELVRLWESGYDVVRTIRDSTEDASWAKSFTSKYYYKLMNKMADVPIVEGGSDFRLMNSKALGTLKRFREHGRFLRGIVGALGYRQAELHFVAPPRFAGVSKFSVRKMIRFALDGVTAFSRVPLRAALYVGVLCGGLSFLLILHLLYVYLTGQALNGWTTLGVSILFIGGIQLVGLGIIGEYVGRIFEEVKQRPLYWVKSAINFDEHEDAPLLGPSSADVFMAPETYTNKSKED